MGMILSIDQGTTSSRALLFDAKMQLVVMAQQDFAQHYPASGWVEHAPDDLWKTTLSVCRQVLQQAGVEAKSLAAIGITNQRETTLVWDRATGRPIHPAIVWQDRRTASLCRCIARRYSRRGFEKSQRRRISLLNSEKIARMV